MKRIFTFLVAVFLTTSVFTQSPQKISYQAVIRDNSNQLVINQQVGMQISILQDSGSGVAVYIETQIPTTNANGLVSVEIGTGMTNDDFSAIDWSIGPYFVKTETDLTGGSVYTITGISQLLSVPYALYALTAETISNIENEHFVGELYGGGVVFWVDHTNQHGLICSMIDLNTAQQWSNITSTLIGPTAQSEWDGLNNSNEIVNQPGHTNSAALLCLNYVNTDYGTGIYSDWYLPSRGEFNDLYNNFKAVQKTLDTDENSETTAISRDYYWTSSEFYWAGAYAFAFQTGFAGNYDKYSSYYVRAIRAF